jgi:uncharacterized paraquat-inducible protein A
MEYQKLIACHECDLLFRKPSRVRGQVAYCSRCGASLKGIHGAGLPLDWICAVTVAALITFFIAQAFPVIELNANGMASQATLFLFPCITFPSTYSVSNRGRARTHSLTLYGAYARPVTRNR